MYWRERKREEERGSGGGTRALEKRRKNKWRERKIRGETIIKRQHKEVTDDVRERRCGEKQMEKELQRKKEQRREGEREKSSIKTFIFFSISLSMSHPIVQCVCVFTRKVKKTQMALFLFCNCFLCAINTSRFRMDLSLFGQCANRWSSHMDTKTTRYMRIREKRRGGRAHREQNANCTHLVTL